MKLIKQLLMTVLSQAIILQDYQIRRQQSVLVKPWHRTSNILELSHSAKNLSINYKKMA